MYGVIMSEKETCPVCESHTSDIYYNFIERLDCPCCGSSFETVNKINKIREEKKRLKSKGIEKNIVDENALLKEKLALIEESENSAMKKLAEILYKLEDVFEDLKIFTDKSSQ